MYDKVHLGQTCIECFDIIRSLIPKKKNFTYFFTNEVPEYYLNYSVIT